MGGLGTVNTRQKHGYYDKAYAFCDVCVIGAGPAGLSAALEAAAAGAEVIIIDDQALPGGALSFAREEVDGDAEALRRSLLSQIEAQPSITLWSKAICQGWFTDHWLPVTRGDRLYKVRATAVVIATGTIGQQVVFRNNDMPGIMLGSAAQRLMRLYGVRPGTRAVILAADEAGYGVALDLIDAGVEVAALLDLRTEVPASPLAAAVRERGVPVRPRMAVAEAVEGRNHLSAVRIAQVVGEGTLGTAGETIACDLLCLSAGGVPNAALVCHAGGSVRHDAASGRFVVASTPPDLFVAGSVAGTESFAAAMAGGRRAGWQAARAAGFSNPHEPQVEPASAAPAGPMPWPIFPHPKGKDFVDFDEDLTVSHVRDAVAAGFDSVELLKRYSTAGMGPSQGRITNPVLYRLLAQATGQSVEAVGSVTVRPPIGQEKIGHLAGRGFDPVRLSPIHHRHQELGATMMVAGTWLRPAVYGEGGQEASIRDEVRAVRNGVGLIDVSTLGKIEVRGPDAAAFLERIYTFAFAAQPVSRVRYALMTDEVGNVMDDGVAARLHAHHFYVTATTGGADGVYRFMQWCNAQWRLAVDIANVTAAYAAVNIAGPRARAVLARLDGDLDLAPEAFPTWRCVRGCLPACRCGHSGSASSVSSATNCTCLRVVAKRSGIGCLRRGKARVSGPSASRRSGSCAWRRATSSLVRIRTAFQLRGGRARLGALEEETVLRRQGGARSAAAPGHEPGPGWLRSDQHGSPTAGEPPHLCGQRGRWPRYVGCVLAVIGTGHRFGIRTAGARRNRHGVDDQGRGRTADRGRGVQDTVLRSRKPPPGDVSK